MGYVIKNNTPSILALAPLKDLLGNNISLQPAGKAGDSIEVDEHMLKNPIAERMLKANWIIVNPAQHSQPQELPAGPPAPQATATPMPPRSAPPPEATIMHDPPPPPPPLPPAPSAQPSVAMPDTTAMPAPTSDSPTLDTKPASRPSKPTKP